MAITFGASLITAAGVGYAGYETAQPGAPRRQQMSSALGAVGFGIGLMVGYPGLGSVIGSLLGNLLFQGEVKKIEIPEDKNDLFTPQSKVSSNVVIPLGFGVYHCIGNIVDFTIVRDYSWYNTLGDLPQRDERDYTIALGISANPAKIVQASIGGFNFHDSNIMFHEEFPNGGRASRPEIAMGFYDMYQKTTETHYRTWDTDWVVLFDEYNHLRFHCVGSHNDWATAEEMAEHIDVYIHKKVNGQVSVKKLEASDWTVTDLWRRYYEVDVPPGEYKFTYSYDNWFEDRVVSLNIWIIDSDWVNLENWIYACNWLILNFSDEELAPETSDFDLILDQGESNPIAGLKSYLTNDEWGLGIPEEKLHTTSFDALQVVCDAASPKLTFNGLFTSQSTPQDIINQFLIVSKAMMVYSEGKLKLVEDKFSMPTKSFEESNTLQNTFQYAQRDTNAMISRFKLDFEDSEHNYIVRSILFDDPDLIEKIGIKDTSKFLTGVNTEEQATDIGRYVFRTLRQPNVPGDMVEVIRPVVQYGDVMRVIDLQEQENGDIQVSMVSYFPDDEIIVISTEDEFREGTFVDCEIANVEDGEVSSNGGWVLPEFEMITTATPLVTAGVADIDEEMITSATVEITVV
jgi:hypothetical protein